ncbi:MAG: phosphatidate cytidylyltransferase [Clostridia bacterium]|nr:phosphatidate cytidylyltransferase [Clostridia bacterium]
MNNLKKRLITGSLIFAVFVGVILLTLLVHWVFFDVFVLALATIAAIEVSNAIGSKFPKPVLPIALVTLVLGYAGFVVSQEVWDIGGITTFFSVVLVMSLILVFVSVFHKSIGTNNVVSTMFVLIYPICALMYMMGFNHMHEPYRANAILMLFAVSPLTDTFAYFVGTTLKGKKLCPKISPNKTISGAIGGLIGGVLAGTLLFFLSKTGVGAALGMGPLSNGASNCINFICVGLACSVATQVGDLLASYIKRLVGIKDYSNLLPGHGGIMDRIDGMIVGAVVIFLYFSILMAI